MLEFAKVTGLVKIFNRDDWQKVFLACSELPDYRESKYSSYFVTKDATVRAGKLYYEKNALEKGGYSYDPISHIKLVNEKEAGTPEDRSFCFGAGEKYEFNNFVLEAKYVDNERNITPDVQFDPNKKYYVKKDGEYVQCTGYTKWVEVTNASTGVRTYYCNLAWMTNYNSFASATNIAGTAISTLQLLKLNTAGEYEVIPAATVKNWKDDTTYAPPKFDGTDDINIWVAETSADFEEAFSDGLIFKAGAPITSLHATVYDTDTIGHKTINRQYDFYYRQVTAVTPTKDTKYVAGKQYFGWDGYSLYELYEDADYTVGDPIVPDEGITITDDTCNRTYNFVPITLDDKWTEWTEGVLARFGYHVYRIAADLDFYTINSDRGTLHRVSYLGTGDKISDAQMGKPTDLKFKKGHAYYKRSKATLYTEPGYELMTPAVDHFSYGGSIADYVKLTGTEVFMHILPFWVVNEDVIGQITHGKPWYEKAGTNYPYEGFVAVTTEKTDTNARGQFVTCKRRTYMVTEDLIHGYTGDGAAAVSKPYFEYHADTNKYVKVPTETKPMFRMTDGSSFIQTTGDTVFDADRKYYKDIMATTPLRVGTQAQVDAGEADVAAGTRVDMYPEPVYDRHRKFYYRGKDKFTGDGTWDFHPIDNPYGITTDKKWKTVDGALMPEHYRFFNVGSDYSFTFINEPFSVVDDAIFGYKDLNDQFYGYEALTAGKDYTDGVTTVAQYLATRAGDNIGSVAREDINTHELTDITAGSTVMSTKNEEGVVVCAYHLRNYDHVAQNKTDDAYKSIYCTFDNTEGKITADNIDITDALLGTRISDPVYRKMAEVPSYYWMEDPANPVWRNKFSPFSLLMSPTVTDDTSPVTGTTYYVGNPVYTVSYDTSWGPTRDTETTSHKTWNSTYKYYFKEEGEFVEVPDTYKDVTASPMASNLAGKPVYIISDRTYTETEVGDGENPHELGLYVFLDSYYGRRIASQSKIIYTNTLDGSVPTECLVFVAYDPDEADEGTTKSEDADYADGEEIPAEPALYIESRNGEAILPDEYYEECYGLFYWDQFFLKRNISASVCTNVQGYVCQAVNTAGQTVAVARLNWSDPGFMLKKDEPTSNPDAWNRTTVVLNYDGRTVQLYVNTSKDAFEDPANPLIIDTSEPEFLNRYREVFGATATATDFRNALITGNISLVATGASGMTSECMYKLKDLRIDNSGSYAFVDIFTGQVLTTTSEEGNCTADFEDVNGVTGYALPDITYLTPGNKGVWYKDPYVYPHCTQTNSTEFKNSHKFVFDKNTPLFLISARANMTAAAVSDVLSIDPVIVGYGSTIEGADISQPADIQTAEYTLKTRYCAYVQLTPSITLNEIVRSGRAEDILSVGSEIDMAEVIKPSEVPPTTTETTTSATVVDIGHVVLKRRVPMKKELITEGGGHLVAEEGVTYYAPYAVDDYENYKPADGNHLKFTAVKLPAGVLIDNKFYQESDDMLPQHQFYTRTWDERTRSASYQAINYEVDENWMDKVLVTGVQIFYRSRVLNNNFVEFVDDKYSVTCRMNDPSFTSTFDDAGNGRWIGSGLRTTLNEDEEGYSEGFEDFANCIRQVANTTFDVKYEFYEEGDETKIRVVDQYFESVDGTFKEGKTYYALVDGSYVLYTNYNVGDPIPASPTIYEQLPRSYVTFDKFWVPSLSQVGIDGVSIKTVDAETSSEVTIPIPTTPEGSCLDAFIGNPQIKDRFVKAASEYYRINPRIMPKTGGLEYWLRTRINAAHPGIVTTIDRYGHPGNVEATSAKNVFPFFTFG